MSSTRLNRLRVFASRSARISGRRLLAIGWIGLCLVLSGCGISMYDQAKVEPYERSDFFPDNLGSRIPPAGTVARGDERLDAALYTGQENGQFVDTPPVTVSRELLERGQQRYNIYCSPCHGLSGYGDGEIVRRGFSPPPSFHDQRLRDLPNGKIFDVITNGYGAMYPYGYRVAPEDRWAIIAYVRALQLSQNATPSDVPQGKSIEGAQP